MTLSANRLWSTIGAIDVWGRSLRLREFSPDDIDQVENWIHLVHEGEPGLWMQEAIDHRFATPRQDFTFAIDCYGIATGAVRLSIDSLYDQRAEIGFVVAPSEHSRGIATASVEAVQHWAFTALGLHRIWAVTDPANVAAQRVLEKAGHEFEGRLRHDRWISDAWRDSLIYGLVRSTDA